MFEKYEPQAGDQILSAHIRNLEDYIAPLITIDNGSEISGVTKLIIGNNLLASGTVSGGITLYTTGIAGFTTNLSGLTDVDVSGSTVGDLLIKNSDGKWRYVPSGSVGGGSISLDNLTDVITTGAISGDLLMLNSDGIWRGVSTGSVRGTFALSGATDTNINLATDGSLLVKSGGLWTYMSSGVLVDSNYLDELVDVSTSGAITGDILMLNNSGVWVNVASGHIVSNATDLKPIGTINFNNQDISNIKSIFAKDIEITASGLTESFNFFTSGNTGIHGVILNADRDTSSVYYGGHVWSENGDLFLGNDGIDYFVISSNKIFPVNNNASLGDLIAPFQDIYTTNIYSNDYLENSGLMVIGNNAGSNPQLILKGATTGDVIFTVNSNTNNWVFTLPTNAGTSGQYLQTNGSGVTSWVTPSITGGVGSSTLSGLTDVNVSGATTGHLLILNSDNIWRSIPSGSLGGSSVTTLDSLTDVVTTGATTGDILILNSDNIWRTIPSGTFGTSNVTTLDSLTDVVTTGATSGHLLLLGNDNIWRSVPSGTVANAGSYSLSGLTDVNVSGATTGDLLIKTNSGKWQGVSSGSVGRQNSVAFPAIYSNIYVGLEQEYCIGNNCTVSSFFIYADGSATGTNTFDIYVDRVAVATGVTLVSQAKSFSQMGVVVSYNQVVNETSLIRFVCTRADNVTLGNPIFFGYKTS